MDIKTAQGKENQGVGVAIAAPTPQFLCPFSTQLLSLDKRVGKGCRVW